MSSFSTFFTLLYISLVQLAYNYNYLFINIYFLFITIDTNSVLL